MEAEFIPLLVSFGYDQLTNYVKNKHLSIAGTGEEEGIFYHVFILETLTWLYYVGKNVRLFSLKIFDVWSSSPSLYPPLRGWHLCLAGFQEVKKSVLLKGKDKIALNYYTMTIHFTQYKETSLIIFVPH